MQMRLRPEQIETILSLRRSGLKQKEICERTKLSKFLVARELKRANMGMYKPVKVDHETEQKIFALLGQNHGQPFIARTLGLRPHVVQTILRRRGYQKPRGDYGCKYHLGEIELRNIRRDYRDLERKIAAAHGVGHAWLRRFRTSAAWWGNSGSRHWKKKRAAAVDFAALADEAVTRYQHEIADERLSRIDCAEILCESTMQSFPHLRNAAPDVQRYFRAELVIALQKRLAEGGANRWLN